MKKKKIILIILVSAILIVLAIFLGGLFYFRFSLLNIKKENIELNNKIISLKGEKESLAIAKNNILQNKNKENMPSGEASKELNVNNVCVASFNKDLLKECPFLINDAIDNISLVSEVSLNGKKYSSKNDIKNIKTEMMENKYNMINDCLYFDGKRAMEYGALLYYKLGFFKNIVASNYADVFDSENKFDRVEEVSEWFRFKDGNILKIYLKGVLGCGGCIYNGPILNIDLTSGEITGEFKQLPYLPWMILSPLNKKAIEVVYIDNDINTENIDERETELYVYDFSSGSRKYIYKIPNNKEVMVCGDGCYPNEDMIKWMNEKEIQIKFYEKDGSLSPDIPVVLKVD